MGFAEGFFRERQMESLCYLLFLLPLFYVSLMFKNIWMLHSWNLWNLLKTVSQGQPVEKISPANSMKDRHECRMGFIGIRKAVNRMIKGREKKKKPCQRFMRITLQRLRSPFLSFVKLWLWGNMLLRTSRRKCFSQAPNVELQNRNESDIVLARR